MRWSALLLTLLYPLALPALAEEQVCCEIGGDKVRLRAGPGTKHAVLASLDRGALVIRTGREGRWCRVTVPGGFACYVHASLVRRGGDGSAIVNASRVLLRATAGKDLLPLETVLERGDEVTVLGEKGEWLRVVPPDRAHLYVFDELVRELGPVSEYRAAIERASRARRKVLLGTVEKKVDEELKRRELKEAALAAGEAVLAGEGDLEELTATLRRVSMDSDDDLTRGYANALLALLSLRADAERLEKALAELDREREEEVVDLEKRLGEAEKRYRDALEKARVLRNMRKNPFRGFGTIVKRDDGFALVDGGRLVYRLVSDRFRLEDYVGKRVGLNGRMVVTDPKTGATHLKVEKIEIQPGGTEPR